MALGCSDLGPMDPSRGVTYVLRETDGHTLPAPLGLDTIPGTASSTLIADTLQFQLRGSRIEGVNVWSEQIVGSAVAPLIHKGPYAYSYLMTGSNTGSALNICMPPGAPCAYLPMTFAVHGDSLLVLRQSTQTLDIYLRLR